MKRPDQELMRKALLTYGKEHQENKCIEECSELIAALLKFREGRINLHELISEMVDVEITLEQMKMLHASTRPEVWDTEMDYKLERLSRRIRGGALK